MTLSVPHSDAPLDLRAAARDLWPGGTLRRWLGEPLVAPARVLWPSTDAEVVEALAAATAAGAVIVPYGAGSGVCGGAAGRPDGWVIDTKRMDTIGEVDPATWTVEVGAGVNGELLEHALEAQGYTLGHSPSSIGCSTVGGWAAARSAGQFSSRYGVFEDMVVGLDAVSPGVGAFCVGLPGVSSPAHRAPDAWMPLLLGSEGTLAVITRLRVRVRPLPAARWLRGYAVADVPAALAIMRTLMQEELWPAVVRLYDPVDTLVGGRTRPKPDGGTVQPAWWKSWLAAVDRMPEVHRRTLALPLALPGLLQSLADRLAKGCLLIVGWEGEADVVAAASEAGHRIVSAAAEDLGPEPGERWYRSRHAVSYKLMPVFERGGFADTMEIAGRWSVLKPAYDAVRAAVGGSAVIMAHMSHVYPEGGCIYFSFAGRGDVATYERTWARALAAVEASGATVTHHHGVGTLKAASVSREVGAAVAGWTTLRAQLDPEGRMNPGRVFVPVDDHAVPARVDTAGDGLRWTTLAAPTTSVGAEARWGWERLPGPARWQREAWQTDWVEVRGRIGGREVALGRGPRSAAGPDLRPFLAEQDPSVEVSVGTVLPGDRWCAEVTSADPWGLAQTLLRADLRPAVLEVDGGVLRVGFRGPAARAFGAIVAARCGSALREVAWRPPRRSSGPLERAEAGDPAIAHATTEHFWKLKGAT